MRNTFLLSAVALYTVACATAPAPAVVPVQPAAPSVSAPIDAGEYGLRVDWWVDERADPERSTRAAAAYLGDLYRTFNDWGLALAAYNCGPGRVKRTLEDAGATTFWELLDAGLLPKETRGYVPTFFA